MTENPVSVFLEKGESFMRIAFSRLLHEYLFFTIAVVLAVIPLLLFVFMQMKGKAYLFKDTSSWKGHYLLMFCILLSAAKNLWNTVCRSSDFSGTGVEKKIEIAVSVMLIFFALFVVFRLFFYQISGIIGAVIYIWLFAGFKNFRGIALGFLQLPSILEQSTTNHRTFSLPEQIGAYAMADYSITLAMTISFLALILTLFLGVYYYRRRYIFLPSRLARFVKCDCCGKPAMKDESFCGCCGAKLQTVPDLDPVLDALDTNRHCTECGAVLIKGNCLKCGSQTETGAIRSNIPLFITMFLVFMAYWFVLYGPEKLSLIYILPANISEQSQSYSDTYNEFIHNPALASDANWQNRFYTDCGLLYLYDSKWAYRDVRGLRSNDWIFYMQFGKASFEQMIVLEQIKSEVETLAEEFAEEKVLTEERKQEIWTELDPLTEEFNRTVSAQEDAQADYTLHPSRYIPVETLEYDLFDGFRFYLQYINTRIAAAILLTASFFAASYVLNRFSRYLPALAFEKKYIQYQKSNETGIAKLSLSFADMDEKRSIANRAGILFVAFLCRIIRFVNELWMLLLTLATAIGIFLSLFRLKNIRRVKNWLISRLKSSKYALPEHTYDAYKKAKRKGMRNMLVWFIVCLLIIHIWNTVHEPKVDEVEKFMELSSCAYQENAPQIVAHLIQADNRGTIDEETKEELYQLIENGLDNIRKLEEFKDREAYAATVQEKYPEYWNGVFSFCDLDRSYLEILQKDIEEGTLPDQTTIEQYVKLRKEDFQWLNEIYQNYAQKRVNNELEDIAGDFVD